MKKSAKVKTHYSCQECGFNSPKWLGKCPGCEAWNSLVEEHDEVGGSTPARETARRIAQGKPGEKNWSTLADADDTTTTAEGHRYPTGMTELDRVLGGGLVRDSFVLIGGDPGVGKSTLILQMLKGLREKEKDLRILYVTGEESIEQIRSRAKRIGVPAGDGLFLASETSLEKAFELVWELQPKVLLMDSLQTFSSSALESAPGSVSQLREVAMQLMTLAKSAGICVWLVGHVTKDGNIAGPKVVEHMVDTVLYFEAEGGQSYRLLRTVKNRFGSARELGVFEMDGEGLREVTNPSQLFLSERTEPVPGTAVSASLEGSRPILVELQALVAPSSLSVPRRTSVGMDGNRISLLAAILERHMKLDLGKQDLFFNVAGGLRLTEPACDLAAAAAIWSSDHERPLPPGWVFLGELGLTGEIRRVSQGEVRLEEAKKLGFEAAVVPRSSLDRLSKVTGIRLIPISRIEELPGILPSMTASRAKTRVSRPAPEAPHGSA